MATPKTLDEILSGSSGKGKGKGSAAREMIRTLSTEHKKMIMGLVENKNQIKRDQEMVKDDTKAIADKLGIKTGEMNKIVSLIIKEQEKGGAIQLEENILDLATQVLDAQAASAPFRDSES